MQNDDNPISVQALIKQYNEELLKTKKRYDATQKEKSSAMPVMASLDSEFPVPNVEQDLAKLRENSVDISNIEAENNAVNEESGGQTTAPPSASLPPFPMFPLESDVLPPSAPPPREMSLGYLKAFVTTARGALPIPNAQVIVTRLIDGDELLEQAARTDVSGYSPLFSLPAVSGNYSLNPENTAPFTYYNMYVRADGFYPVRIREIPMYGGITAIQPVDLIPIAEGETEQKEQIITEGAPEISNGATLRGGAV